MDESIQHMHDESRAELCSSIMYHWRRSVGLGRSCDLLLIIWNSIEARHFGRLVGSWSGPRATKSYRFSVLAG